MPGFDTTDLSGDKGANPPAGQIAFPSAGKHMKHEVSRLFWQMALYGTLFKFE